MTTEITRLEEIIEENQARVAAAMQAKNRAYNDHCEAIQRRNVILDQLSTNPGRADELAEVDRLVESSRASHKALERAVAELRRDMKPWINRKYDLDQRARNQARAEGVR